MRWGYSSTGANRSCSRQQGKAAVDRGIGDLRMILPLPMAIDATACLACGCRRAKQRLPKVSVHPVVAAPRAGTGARSCGETRPAVVAGTAPKHVARNALL